MTKEISLIPEEPITPKVPSIHKKLKAVKENVRGSISFIRAFCEYTLHNDNWNPDLEPVREKLKAFIITRSASPDSYNDVVQYGSLFLATLQHFFRGEHVEQNVALTEKEKIEMSAEFSEIFADANARKDLMTYAAAIGWQLIIILDEFVDHKAADEQLAKKIESLKLNFSGMLLSDKLQKTMVSVDKGLVLADKLKSVGIIVKTDGTIKTTSEQGAAAVAEMEKDVKEGNKELFDEGIDAEEIDLLNTPLGKLICECTSLVKL